MLEIKICGVRVVAEAVAAVHLGATAIGLNFVPASPRHVDPKTARAIANAVHAASPGARVVGVIANLSIEAARALALDVGLDDLQLHGDESAETVRALLPSAYKAVRVGDALDVERARGFPGERILVDAKVPGLLGGTGARVDTSLLHALTRERHVILAGGLGPDNVEEAVRALAPFGVDVASGVESRVGQKDLGKVAAFIAAARRAG